MVSLEDATEPPLTRRLSEQEVWDIALRKSTPKFADIPCHTQAVERGVKMITEAAKRVCGENSRDGYIRCRLESRRNMSKFDTKSHFLSML